MCCCLLGGRLSLDRPRGFGSLGMDGPHISNSHHQFLNTNSSKEEEEASHVNLHLVFIAERVECLDVLIFSID